MTTKVTSADKIGMLAKKIRQQGKKIVLAGGCFDVLHPGHVIFLEKAKKQGDSLIVLLESDLKVKRLKGNNRPVYSQKLRAKVLSALEVVDIVVMLPDMKSPTQYDSLVLKIKPDVIAATAGNRNLVHLYRAAVLVGAKLKLVAKRIGNYSTTLLISSSAIQ